jgi:undecaprenyl-diphosphatase
MSPADGPRRFPVWQALVLGALHGPAELLPISSSGHTGAIPWLLGWSYSELDAAQRKSFEVALHAGTAAAMALSWWRRLSTLDGHAFGLIGVSAAPAAAAGLTLQRVIEERLGDPGSIATGLVAGSLVMAAADRAPERRGLPEATGRDALWLGVAQALALVPGVSRQGATVSAARLRRFRRAEAYDFSDLVGALPILGATALRVRRRALAPGLAPAFAAGAASAFAATLLSASRLRPIRWPLWPFAVYRVGLAGAIVWRIRPGSRAARHPRARR